MTDYFAERAPTYLEKSRRGLWKRFRDKEFAAVVRLMRPEPGMTALDLGCGAGFYAIALRRQFAMEVMAVDSSPAMLQALRFEKIKTWLGHAEELPEWLPFDRVLSAGLLEFVAQPQLVLRGCARLTKQYGFLTIIVPNDGLSGMVYKAAHEWRGCPVFMRAPRDYVRMASDCGFELAAREECTLISTALSFRLRDPRIRLKK